MNTKWNMAIFLFVGLIAAVMLISAAVDRRLGHKPMAAIVAALFSAAALFVIIAGLNDPSKIIRILGAPSKGISSAIIMQAVTLLASIFTFAYFRKNRPLVSFFAVAVAVVSVCSLGRMYMTTTRPALNSWLISVLLLLLVIQAVTFFLKQRCGEYRHYPLIASVIAVFCGVMLSVFLFRIGGLSPQDRALDIHLLMQVPLLCIIGGIVLLCVILPLFYSLLFRKYAIVRGTAPVFGALQLCGIFLMSVLINQMPLIEKGINNRIFF